MNQAPDDFDPVIFTQREPEVLAVLAKHVCALSQQQLDRLEDEGVVLINLQALEVDEDFGLDDLRIAFVESGDTVQAVEAHFGLVWIASFAWLNRNSERDEQSADRATNLCCQEVLSRVLSFGWYELVLWELEERWLIQS
jgi:hypothetical protein